MVDFTDTAQPGEEKVEKSAWMTIKHYSEEVDIVGLLLMGFGFGCFLTPFTLSTTAKNGFGNRK
jgi:hypothetical protein